MQLNHAESDKGKKGVSNIIAMILLILIVLSVITIIWIFTRDLVLKSPLELNCLDYIDSLKIESACYLENNELKLIIRRDLKDLEINKFSIMFSPSDSLWAVSGKKCLDIRINDNSYGNYCEIVSPGESTTYTFNMTNLDKQKKIALYINNDDSLCTGDSRIINDVC